MSKAKVRRARIVNTISFVLLVVIAIAIRTLVQERKVSTMTEMDIKKFFYQLAVYGNFHWKACMSQSELFDAALTYYDSYRIEPNGSVMRSLLGNLREDALNGNGDAKGFMDQLVSLLNGKEVRV